MISLAVRPISGLSDHIITFNSATRYSSRGTNQIFVNPTKLREHQPHPVHTTSQNELYTGFCKLFSESSTGIPALLPCSLLPRQARGTLRKLFTKPHCTVHFGT